jgi:hypothetical protein
MIAEDSTLMHLGALDNIDVVFAEVARSPQQELRRLVLLEDKLMKNPEAKRAVLTQILEYANTVQEKWRGANLREKLRAHAEWVTANYDELRWSCERGDFLLVIAGDGIDERMEKLARRFAGRQDPLNLMELALVSMAVYSLDDSEFLLVPHVVSAVHPGHHHCGGRKLKNRHKKPRALSIGTTSGLSSRSCTRPFRYSRTEWTSPSNVSGILHIAASPSSRSAVLGLASRFAVQYCLAPLSNSANRRIT